MRSSIHETHLAPCLVYGKCPGLSVNECLPRKWIEIFICNVSLLSYTFRQASHFGFLTEHTVAKTGFRLRDLVFLGFHCEGRGTNPLVQNGLAISIWGALRSQNVDVGRGPVSSSYIQEMQVQKS